jgi:hypothetical protein
VLTIGAYSPPFAPRTGQKVSETYLSRNEGIPEILWAILFSIGANAGGNSDPKKPPPITDGEMNALVTKVRTTWRAQDGETADEIIAKTAKVAHFIARGWDVAQTMDGHSKSVVFSWVKHPEDKEGEEYTFGWDIKNDGSLTVGPNYAKTMELGWQAFALSIIQSEKTDGDLDVNNTFLHDLSNLNFVNTAQGKLGDLLKIGRCSLGDPVGVDYLDSWGRANSTKGDFWRLQISVDCELSGPRYFTRDGLILFLKQGADLWRPYSFFAHRLVTYPVGSWFKVPDAVEQQVFARTAAVVRRDGQVLTAEDIEALASTSAQ